MNQLLWFKRDLRVVDHNALANAMQKGPVLAVYILEPELWQQPDVSGRQFAFLTECVQSLRAIDHMLPIFCPLFSPHKRPLTNRANFFRQC